ncbi:hypothetical protein IMY05_C4559000600 [Salix suchowensis]|nr:hypothetical protein IMY05_C4559000600 [Salix suchowensis]
MVKEKEVGRKQKVSQKANLDEEGGSAKSQAKRHKVSESPVKLMTGSRKRTTEHPGLVGKRKCCTTKEVQAERAEKEACALAAAEAKTNAVAQLASMAVQNADSEVVHWRHVAHQLSALEIVSKDDDAEVFNWSPVNNYVESDSEMVEDLAVVAATPKQKVVELIGPNSTDSSLEESDNVAVHSVPKVKHTSKIVTPDSDSDSPIRTTTRTWKLKTAIVPKRTNRMNDPKAKAVNWSSVLASQIAAAKSFKTLPSSFSNSHAIKKFRTICYFHWMRSDDPFNDFMLESPVLLSVVQQALEEAFPNSQYTPRKNDIFH